MYLAQRLNELAQANADGLLSDDEYRLLRHSAFELYSGNDEPPQQSMFPTEMPQDTPISLSPSRTRPKDVQHGLRLSLSVSGLFRRATAKVSPPAPSPTTPESATKRRFIPRLFGRKPDLPPLRIVPPPPQSPPPSMPLSPLRTTLFPPSDDHNLVSTNEIQDAITSLDSELRGLVDAFDNLEQSAVRRIKKRSARRLPATTPESVDVLLEGREWREHRRIGPPRTPSSPVFQARYHLALDPVRVSDGLSVHSERTSFSYAASPTRSTFRTHLSRKASVSSISSKSTSLLSASRLGVTVSSSSQALSSLSHSSSNLPSRALSSVLDDDDDELQVVEELEDEADQLSELREIQQRRSEVIMRYNQRIEYLKAKHKGAELRERLLRK